MEQGSIHTLHKKYVKGTARNSIVIDKKILLCNLKKKVRKSCNLSTGSVYITTRVLKHIYDDKPAEWYDFILEHLIEIVKYPDYVYKNKNSKRGDLCLVKTIKDEKYFCSIEICIDGKEDKEEIMVVTVFRTGDSYIKKYELLWSWRDDAPSS